ncbi:RidA family protein [Phytoactinopolyspora alkaliphila]|uniref:RidA family protein n=1 Tax=Phytoactinopolyspora alkaliphila TaxID=1783498 RepID=A0A6N9YPX6_9ACTN|nr:RidA family protein [Phytoactinopolyspora alkaliphila]NED96898.1 RidA family protein [Phytoactinopolyspora alkaliphila]
MPRPDADGNTANFSPAVRAGGLLFVSGQASVDEEGTIVPGTFAEEMDRSIHNVGRVLGEHGLDLGDVVRVGAYVQDPADLGEFNALYRQYFSPPLPARTTITSCLTDKIKFEIDVVAAFR